MLRVGETRSITLINGGGSNDGNEHQLKKRGSLEKREKRGGEIKRERKKLIKTTSINPL